MEIIRLKRDSAGKMKIRYSEGFFGGLFGQGVWLDRLQLQQRFKGQIPDEIEVEIRPVTHDEEREETDQALRNRVIRERREKTEKDIVESRKVLSDIEVREALERLQKRYGK